MFMYGNYDNQSRLPGFDLYLGPNFWDSLGFRNSTHVVIKESIYNSDYIDICLVNTGYGVPFISAIELRLLNDSIYRPVDSASSSPILLHCWYRYDLGGEKTNMPIRYNDDVYDRLWYALNLPKYGQASTPLTDDNLSNNEYRPPATVMRTAITPGPTTAGIISLAWGPPNLDTQYYVYLHFANISAGDQSRIIGVYLNDQPLSSDSFALTFSAHTVYTQSPVRGARLTFEVRPMAGSVLPPLVNAIELYRVIELRQSPTQQTDVGAMTNIKKFYGLKKNWQGDPCMPEQHLWEGLNCSNKDYSSPKIIGLNLTSSGLAGVISPAFSNLSSLQYLDLSHNSLTGSVPEFLAQLPLLRVLNLSRNKLTGSIPEALMKKVEDNTLLLSIDGNPDLCPEVSCKRKKRPFPIAWLVVIVVVVVTVVIMVLSGITILCRRFRRKIHKVTESQEVSLEAKKKIDAVQSKKQVYTFSEIMHITDNCNPANMIGEGGFGKVYLGTLQDGTKVAIKIHSPSPTSGQGLREFKSEAEVLMRVHHNNLVRLIGYCDEGAEKALIYEYMAGGDLKKQLSEQNSNVLGWQRRLQIAIDAACGLDYMHSHCEPSILHRDLKTENILVHENGQAKIADLGLCRNMTESKTHVTTTHVAGTLGYLDPEYQASGQYNKKSDVYSFGVILCVLITGKPAILILGPSDRMHISDWMEPQLARGDIEEIIDLRIRHDIVNMDSARGAANLAMRCLARTQTERPLMEEVLLELKRCLSLEMPVFQRSRNMGSCSSTVSSDTSSCDLERSQREEGGFSMSTPGHLHEITSLLR